VSYRDDVDSLYMRASALQRELDRAQAELAQRDAELAAMRDRKAIIEWPQAEPLPPPPAPPPVPQVLEAACERLGQLDPESLVLVGAIIEELAMEPARRAELLARLRPIVVRIAGAHRVA